MYQIIVQYPKYHQYLRRQNELCLLNLLITLCPLLLLIHIKVRIFLTVVLKLPLLLSLMIFSYILVIAPCYLVLLNVYTAFDNLDYNIISIGINEISIHGQIHSWFMYFVSSRTSTVKINSSLYSHFNIGGIPQGSILGPILFIIYIIHINQFCLSNIQILTIIFMPTIFRYIAISLF